jgi:hypothetical protein
VFSKNILEYKKVKPLRKIKARAQWRELIIKIKKVCEGA